MPNIITTTPKSLFNDYTMFYVKDVNLQTVFVGFERMIHFQRLDLLRGSQIFKDMFPDDAIIHIEVGHTGTRNECQKMCFQIMRQFGAPILNQKLQIRGRGISTPIQCIETGQMFESITDAARQMNITCSSLSNHLNDKSGYRTVKNFTFKRITGNQLKY